MASFKKTVLIIAIVVLIITLFFISIALIYATPQPWPPYLPECPDYWRVDGSGNNTVCINEKDLGICPPSGSDPHLTMNFTGDYYTGSQGLCNKYKWANNCKVSWDGITYGVPNPCADTT